jgi:hypothetical protein
MKFFSSLLLLLFVSTNIFSQQKFIEVNVDDTVQVKPDIFVYNIAIENTNNDYEPEVTRDAKAYEKQRAAFQHKLSRLYDSLKTEFTNAGFTLLPQSLESSVQTSEDNNITYTIRLMTTKPDSVKMLYNTIRNTEYAEGYLWLSKAKDETPYLNLLYKKLIEKAQEKATTIAVISGQKLVSIYSVSETNDMSNAGWTAYPPLSQLSESVIPGWHTTLINNSSYMITDAAAIEADYYVIKRSFTVKFTIE